ncbi:DNRLRE domain-containing protein [Patescibacteria group bacterium]|nr:DNRLRE domain-containing protein [Patescibacteria group bacterium]
MIKNKKNRKKIKRILYSFCFSFYSFFKKIFTKIKSFFVGIKIKIKIHNFPLAKFFRIILLFLIAFLMLFLSNILDKKEEKPSYLTKEIEHLSKYENNLVLNSDEIFFNKIKEISEINIDEYNSIKHAIFNIVDYSCDLNCNILDLYDLNLNDFRDSINLALKNDVKKLDINVLLKNDLIKLYIDKNGNKFVVNPNIHKFKLNSSDNEVLLSDVLETEKVYKSIGSGFEMEIYQDYSNGKKVILNNEDYVFYKPKFANYSLGETSSNKIIYKDVYENVDILESIDNTGIKEDIILKNRFAASDDGEFIINYKVETSDLILRVVDGGLKFYRSLSKTEKEESILGVNVRDYSNKQVVMYVPAPYMIDANGEKSENVKFERVIEKDAISEGVYHIRLVADVLDLEFPILIDPSTYVNFLDTGVSNYGIKMDGYWDNSTSTIKSYNNLVDEDSEVWDFSDKSDYVYGDNIRFDNDFVKLINYQGQVYPTTLNSDNTYTVVIQPDETLVSDAYILTEDETSSNYNNNSLMVGNFDGSNYKSLIKFDDLVKFKNIKSAKLTLYHNSSFVDSEEADLNIHKLLKSFDETSVTSALRDGVNSWNQIGASSYYDYSSYTYDTYYYDHGEYYNGEVNFDVTDILNDYSLNDEENYGFLISCDANTTSSRKVFYSSNAASNLRPKLEITFSYPKINSDFTSNDKVSVSWDPAYLKNDNLDDDTFSSYDLWATDLENGFGDSYYINSGINLSSYNEVGVYIDDSSNLENLWIGYLKIVGEKNGTPYENLLDLDFEVSSSDPNFPKENLRNDDISSYFSFDSNSGYIKITSASDITVKRIELYGNNFTDSASFSAVARNTTDPPDTWSYEVELDILSQEGIPTSASSAYKIASISDITETSFLWDEDNEFLTPVPDKEYYLKLGVVFNDSSVLWSPEYNLKIQDETFWQDTIISEDYYYNSYDSFKPTSLNNYSEIGIEVKDSDLEKDVTIDYMEFLGSSSNSSNSNLLLDNIEVSSFDSSYPKENLLLTDPSSYFSFDNNMGYITTSGSNLSLSELKIDGHNFSYDAEVNLVARYSRDGNFYGSYENFEKDSDCIGWAGNQISTSSASSYYLGGYNLAEGVLLPESPAGSKAYVRQYTFDEAITSFRVTQIIRRDDFFEVSDQAPWGWYIDNRYNGSQNLVIRPTYDFIEDTFSTASAVSGYSISDTISYEISEIDEYTRLVSYVVNIPEAQATNNIYLYMYPHNQVQSTYTEHPFQFGLVQITKGDEFYSFSGSPIAEDGIKSANSYEEDLYLNEDNSFTFSAYKDMSDYDGVFRGLFAIYDSEDPLINLLELYQRDSTSEMSLILYNNTGSTEFIDTFSVDSGNVIYDLDINDEGTFYNIELYANSVLKVSESVSKSVFDFYDLDKILIGKGKRSNISYWNSYIYYYEYLDDRVNFDIPDYGYIPTHDANYYSTYIPITFTTELEKITTSYDESLADNNLSFLSIPVKDKFYNDSFYDSMIGYWKLNSSGSYIADSSGNNLYGASVGTLSSASGIYSDSVVLDGSSYIEIPDFTFESKFDELSMFCPAGEYNSGNMCMKCVDESWSSYGADYCTIPELVSDDTVHLVRGNILVLMDDGPDSVNNAIFNANDGDFIYIGSGSYNMDEDLNLDKNVYLRMTGDVYFE